MTYSPDFNELDNGPTIGEVVDDFDARMARLDDLHDQLEREEAAELHRPQESPKKRIFTFGGRLGIGGFRKKAKDHSR